MKKSLLKEIIVWLIVLTGLIIFGFFTYTMGSNKSFLFSSFVTYKSQFVQSTGIYVGAKVTIQGTKTGNVIKVSFLPSGKVEVLFSVRKKHTFGITTASVVELKNAGALGDRFINILTKDISAPKLKKGSLIPYQKSSSLLSVLTGSEGSIQNMMKQIDDLLIRLNKQGLGLLSQANQEDLTQILKSVKNILKKVESGEGTLGALINDRSLYNRLLILLGQRSPNNYLQDLSQKLHKPRN